MKTPTTLFILSFFAVSSLFAQTTIGPNVWLGNTFGPSTDWHHAANWSKGHVPTDMEDVVIPDLSNKGAAHYPVIKHEAEVNRIIVAPQAGLIIGPEGILHIQSSHGEVGLMTGEILNAGLILVGIGDDTTRKPFKDELLGAVKMLSY